MYLICNGLSVSDIVSITYVCMMLDLSVASARSPRKSRCGNVNSIMCKCSNDGSCTIKKQVFLLNFLYFLKSDG